MSASIPDCSREGETMTADRVGYCVRPHNGRLLRGYRATVGLRKWTFSWRLRTTASDVPSTPGRSYTTPGSFKPHLVGEPVDVFVAATPRSECQLASQTQNGRW